MQMYDDDNDDDSDNVICCIGAVGESGEPAWNIAYECRNKVRSCCIRRYLQQLHTVRMHDDCSYCTS